MRNPRELLYLYDEPVPYKTLKIYPVIMKDFINFKVFSTCLILEKDINVESITMSYLKFLYTQSNGENNYLLFLDSLLRLCLKIPDEKIDFGYDDKQNAIFIIKGITYTSDDFDVIKGIIAEQNMLELPDLRKDRHVRNKIKETKEYLQSKSGTKPASLEDDIISLSVYTGWELKNIYEMTIRKFMKAIRRADHIFHQQIYLTSLYSGMVEWKDKSPIKHWMSDLEEDDDDSKFFNSVDEIKRRADTENPSDNV